ncbi:sensor histidine kinase [Dongshaea marina]|uniref:sensor histidine kinase n=1 Tax=Dongshaea marina TaxID=2047966 RepID=UPI000D3E166E|nr:ATP-binding protein [Dongshaea marina]
MTDTTYSTSECEVLRLRQDVSRLTQILEAMPSGLVILDGAGIVCQANLAARNMLDEPLVGERWMGIIKRCFRIRNDDGHEVSLYDGRRVQLSMMPLADEPGQLILITDLTHTRALQDRIAQLKRLSALGKMAASLAHQIRTPLSAAMLYGANLSNQTLSSAARERFSGKLMERLAELEKQINDMLLFARSGEQQIVEPLSVAQIFEQVETSTEAMCLQSQASLSVSAVESSTYLMANSNALVSAIGNLVENALQAGAHRLQLTADNQGEWLKLQLVDDGNGIDSEVRSQIFEPFFTTRTQGTGLGLAVVQAVVRAHQGEISVESQPGKGSRFTLLLPILPAKQRSSAECVGGAA